MSAVVAKMGLTWIVEYVSFFFFNFAFPHSFSYYRQCQENVSIEET